MGFDSFDRAGVRLLDGALYFAELRQVGQAFEVLEAEQLKELGGGFVDNRAARRFLATGNLDEPFFEQRFEHAAGVDAAQLFYLGARDRLSIRDYRDGLHQWAAATPQ